MKRTYTAYILENIENGKRYVGQTTVPLKKRIHNHINHGGSVISKAIKKYGIDGFNIISFKAPNMDALNNIEIALIDQLNSLVSGHGYNILSGGSGWSADDKARRKDLWTSAKRGKMSRKRKQSWLKEKGCCPICGKDAEMGYDPDFDFGLCPDCRHDKHMSDCVGLDFHMPKRKSLAADLF